MEWGGRHQKLLVGGIHFGLEEVQELRAEVEHTWRMGGVEAAEKPVYGGEQHSWLVMLVANEGGVV